MPDVYLQISGPEGEKTAELDPKGTILGRDPRCGIRLNSKNVSRFHARISRDAFGCWIIEDLDSHNGVFSNGQRVQSQALVPGQAIAITDFTLIFRDETEGSTGGDAFQNTITLVDRGSAETLTPYRADSSTVLGPALLHLFNAFTESLLELSSPAELYAKTCHHLAESIQAVVAILRLFVGDGALPPDHPEILAYHVTGRQSNLTEPVPSIPFSRRVLEAACTSVGPIMAHSHPTSDRGLQLTVVDSASPRVVFGARINKTGESVDLLYVDLPAARAVDSMFDFFEAASRQINFTQKRLFFAELEKKERELRNANRELEEQDRIKDEYVFRVTHDIKGHIAAIMSCLEIADANSGVGSTEEKAEFMERASHRAKQLSTFVSELLRLTKLRLSGQIDLASFSLKAAITNALETVGRNASDKHITLDADIDPNIGTITGDEMAITEVVANLLLNAIKYTPEREFVSLRAASLNDLITISVSDTGIGVPETEIDRVFDEFFRASNAIASKSEGTGLGLALVKQIVERHGGTVHAANNAGKGATFSINLPADRTPPSSV